MMESEDHVYGAKPNIGVSVRTLIWNSDLVEALKLDNLIGQAIVNMERTANWMKHTAAWFSNGKMTLDYRPVHDYTMTDEIKYIIPKKRVY